MKYYIISILLHGILIFPFYKNMNTLGDPSLSRRVSVPISYNVKDLPERVDNTKNIKGSEETPPQEEEKPKEKEPPKKIEEDFKSKMKKDEKKKEEKKEPLKETKPIKKPVEKPKEKKKQDPMKNGNFMANADGSYTALSAKGIDFEIVRQVDPDYPRQAEVIRYSKTVVVEARFLVGLDGNIEKIEITKSHEKFGFDKEVTKSLKKWKFKPIVFNGKKLKVYFTKEFIFEGK